MNISYQEIVIAFELDPSIVLTCGTAIKNAQRKVGGRLLSINTPEDGPPAAPRIILRLKDTILNLGLDRVKITTIPPSHVSDSLEKSSKFAFQRAEQLLTELMTSLPEYHWAGVVSSIEYPEEPLKSSSGNESVTPVFNKLINIDRKNRELSSFQLQYGVVEDQYFITYTISGYEGRKVEFKSEGRSDVLYIDPSEYPLFECGVRILLDINNKPNKRNETPLEDIRRILSKTTSLVSTMADDLNMQGILP